MKRINENIALSKSILAKKNITSDSPEYKDYLKIREICGVNYGYVGILTRIRFQDGIEDMLEIQSIYDILKNSKIDVGKLNKMKYDDILSTFYDEFNKDDKNKDYEIVFKDNKYTYYRVYTYEGIMKTGSPAWCLKTKSNWDKYQDLYPMQFVVVSNEYKKKLPVPEDDLFSSYKSRKGYVRYGVSIKDNGDDTINWIANNDNNTECNLVPESWTFYGVMSTLLNIIDGDYISYFDKFEGCEKVENNWHKIVNFDNCLKRLKLASNYFSKNEEVYIYLSETYSYYPILLVLNNTMPHLFYPVDTKKMSKIYQERELNYSILSNKTSKKLFEEYAKKSKSELYCGIKLKLGILSIDDIKKFEKFIEIVDNWAIFNHNSKYYRVVNLNPNEYLLPGESITESNWDIDKPPVFFYLKKDKLTISSNGEEKLPIYDFHKKVIEFLKNPLQKKGDNTENIIITPKVRSFWNFLKGKKD